MNIYVNVSILVQYESLNVKFAKLDYIINKFPKPPELELIGKQWNVDGFDVFFDLHVR